ncbi:glycoside hydrolase [Lineolata rhizophorae]|uniref:AA9 family lytic polysaccharide monooxygenase n=1 Tax=Lineolata rhizophorae TaxID=578093 RepID=A0A6A6NLV4_9PEZI|nr:glycoside hydrolase [Lineolata rhizophorae]
MKIPIFALVLFASLVAAHGGVGTYIMDGETYDGWQPYNSPSGQTSIQREWSTYDPLLTADLSTVKIRCNNNGALGTGPIGEITAGTDLEVHWYQWTHRPAPVFVYMAKCPDSGCNDWDGSGTVWFKVDEAGLISGPRRGGTWAGDQVVDTLSWTSTIPENLAPGDYMIRHEIVALHQAGNPQFYPECAQLTVTGSGTGVPSGDYLVSFPGAYTGQEPGFTMNIDAPDATTDTTYEMPGPALWTG